MNYFPLYLVRNILRSKLSNVSAEGCSLLRIILVVSPDVAKMAIPPCLESPASQSNIGLTGSGVRSGDLAVVNNTFNLPLAIHVALTRKWTILLQIIKLVAGLTTTARLSRRHGNWLSQDLVVVTVDVLGNIFHALVAHLDIILGNHGSQNVAPWESFYQLHEFLPDLCLNTDTVGRIEPGDVP